MGCYVPGGRAAYPSTLLMTAVPAQVAGVAEVAVCVPPDRDTGTVTPVTLAAAAVAGVDEVYAIGGAQAIAALAYGTESVPAVDVICGPGNRYVALAKQEVAGTVGVAAAFAGPSEVVVIADGSVPADFAAIDVILQAEHGPDGLAWLITWDEAVADDVVGRDRSPDRRGTTTGRDRGHPGRGRVRRARGLAGGRGRRSPTWSRPSTSSSCAPIPSRSCPWSTTPARSSVVPGPRRRSATTWPGRATCCRPTARPGSPPRSPWTTSSSTTT